MDLIYANEQRQDLGVLLDYALDLAYGKDENDFECRIAANVHCCRPGFVLYIEGTEYGGFVDAIESDTANQEVIYSGRTWHGVLNSKVIQPGDSDYLIVRGEANAIIATLLRQLGLDNLFQASSESSGLQLNFYQMPRYIPAYDGIRKMLSTVGGKLLTTFKDGKVILSAVAKHDYSQDEEFDSDLMDFQVKQNHSTVNHLICLGRGELSERTVIHLYADADGNISQKQTQFGLDEYAAVYDYSNAESDDELKTHGTERLSELRKAVEMSVDFEADTDLYHVGDIVGAREHITGIFVAAEITKKIVTIKNGQTNISYKVGD